MTPMKNVEGTDPSSERQTDDSNFYRTLYLHQFNIQRKLKHLSVF